MNLDLFFKIKLMTKRYFKVLGVFFVLLICWAYFSSQSVRIGVIDAQRLKEGIEAYRVIAKEQKKYEDVWKVKFMAEKAVLEKEFKDYEKEKMKKTEKLVLLKNKKEQLTEYYQQEAKKIIFATQTASKEINLFVEEVIKKISEDKGVDIVLLKDNLIYSSSKNDFTDEIIELANEKKFKVVYPEPAQLVLPEVF